MAKKNVSAIVSGAGWIASFASELIKTLRERGVSDNDIHSLVTEEGKLPVGKIADVLAEEFRSKGQILKLKLTESFNPAKFIGENWFVWRGPIDGDGTEGEEDRDAREDNLTEVDWSKVLFETMFDDGETITGEEKLLRLKKTGNILLGGKAFLSFWEDWQKNRKNSVLEKLRETRSITYLDFFGLILRSPGGDRNVLYLYFSDDQWDWNCRWLGYDWDAYNRSASLAGV